VRADRPRDGPTRKELRMSTLARRTLRTTAAAAGMAALGAAGVSGTAVAAPAAPSLPTPAGVPELSSALPAVSSATQLVQLPAAPTRVSELPMLFVFEGPTVNTAAPSTRAADTVKGRSSRPAPVRVESDTPDFAPPAASPRLADQIAAMSRLDTANLFDGVPVAGDLPLQFVHR
jgi:hypothetical protein